MKKEEIVMGLYAMRLQGKNRVAQERNNTVDRAVELINQLDEPEQTDTNVGLSKPVIPQFVADYIEQSKKDNDSINQVFAFIDDKENKDLWHWLFPSMYEEKRANQEVFMRAWLYGYEVEKEKLYVVHLPTNLEDDLVVLDARGVIWKDTFPSKYKMTEQQIKDIDERYWAFAEEVTE